MKFHVGIEDIEPNNWVVWVFELPGCYSRGKDRDEALNRTEACIRDHLARLRSMNLSSALNLIGSEDIDVEIAETHQSFCGSDGDYYVNACFDNDRLPLSGENVAAGLSLLGLNRTELSSCVRPLNEAELDRQIPGEIRVTIRGVLIHIATAEWWYLDRLDRAFPRALLKADVFELLEQVRGYTNQILPELEGLRLETEKRQERWTPRKVLRRALWHEHVHTRQIARYLGRLDS